ncbi:MAG: thymidine kinase [Sandaracinaceae bacterium]
MHVVHAEVGWVEVICGPMFSGKSEELIRRLRRAQIARQPLQAFKPAIDDRYHASKIVSHSEVSIEAVPVRAAADILRQLRSDTRVVGIDETQFFDAEIVPVVERIAKKGVRVLLAGLDQDYAGAPFAPMPELMAIAEYVTKCLAICMRCGAPAGRSQRLVPDAGQVLVGAVESYEARCRRCHTPRAASTNRDLFEDA